jgi:hypothetical protein
MDTFNFSPFFLWSGFIHKQFNYRNLLAMVNPENMVRFSVHYSRTILLRFNKLFSRL